MANEKVFAQTAASEKSRVLQSLRGKQAVWNDEYQDYGSWGLGNDGQYMWYPSQVRTSSCFLQISMQCTVNVLSGVPSLSATNMTAS